MGASVDGIAIPNEVAHARARGLILRPGQTTPPHAAGEGGGDGADGDPLTTVEHGDPLTEVTSHYRLGRKSFPDPHRELTRKQVFALRRLQTRSFASPATAHKPGIPFRSIVSERGTWQKAVSTYLQKHLGSLKIPDPFSC
ncbi:hypothetical protein HPB52_009806 [Rhipicephalus sanguineus]|uniref:Tick transposon n=1 Tax=Rhipicephalus sanguineus TaxID=34632 RepID=A0A9D4Q5Q9_RHISA|nr:hypothetical protein HPB52_009806 [Rhipicephalus sanguineus]